MQRRFRPLHSLSAWLRWGGGSLLAGVLLWSGIPALVPLPAGLFKSPTAGTVYLAADGSPLRQLLNEDGQRVSPTVPFAEIPEALVQATLAAEDKRFFSHQGVDLLATTRALKANVRSERIISGASTLTQQLIKISQPAQPRTWQQKLWEALQARHLEMVWGKPQIFETYANRVAYGNLFTGVAAAAEGYFHKPLRDLSVAECAFLAALPQAPGRLNPFRNPAPAMKRQQWVLQRMRALGLLDQESYALAAAQGLRLQRFRGGFAAPHALELIGVPAQARTVRTTLVPELQRRVESIIAGRLEGLRQRHVDHAAVVVLENDTGRVLALSGSRDFFAPDGGQINGAWVPHSPGSALKPFTYALALKRGDTPASLVPDLPVEYQTSTGLYRPENYDHRYYGPMTYRYALGNSLNVSAVRVLQRAGGAAALQALLQQLGLTTLTEPAEHYGLGLTIGNAPVRLLELANAYATLARQGWYRPWTLLAEPSPSKGVRVLDEPICYWLADMLSDNQARVMTFGLHSALRLGFRVAAKTGTSTNYCDNWALGFTPSMTVAVWAGNFNGQPMEDVTGVTGAGPIFHDVFQAVHAWRRQAWYTEPKELVQARIDPRNGKRLTEISPSVRLSRSEIFFGSHLPPPASEQDYEPGTGRALLPPEYAAWVKGPDNWLGDTVITRSMGAQDALRIVSPMNGLVIRLDPDLPRGNQLRLAAEGAETVTWKCATLPLRQEGTQTFAQLVEGHHVITATSGGQSVTVTIQVK